MKKNILKIVALSLISINLISCNSFEGSTGQVIDKESKIEACKDIKIPDNDKDVTAQTFDIKENYTDSEFMVLAFIKNMDTKWEIVNYNGKNWNKDSIKPNSEGLSLVKETNPGIRFEKLDKKIKFLPDKDNNSVKLGMMYQNGMYNMVESDGIEELIIGHSSDLYIKNNSGKFVIKMVLDNPKDGEEPIYEISGKSNGDLSFIRNGDQLLIKGKIMDGRVSVYGDNDLSVVDLNGRKTESVIKRIGKDLVVCNL